MKDDIFRKISRLLHSPLKPAEQLPHAIQENLLQWPEVLRIQTQTVLSGPDIQSIKVSIHTTNTYIEAARIITQIELHIVGVHMKSTFYPQTHTDIYLKDRNQNQNHRSTPNFKAQ
jgi:hypothetical protein